MVSQDDNKLTLTEQMKYHSQLHERLKRCERKIILLHKEQTNLWKRIAESVGELRVMCEHKWIRNNEPYSQLECEICGIPK